MQQRPGVVLYTACLEICHGPVPAWTLCKDAGSLRGCVLLSIAAPPSLHNPQEKRSSYAPTVETPVRYDGIYRIVKCWRTKGKQVSRRARQGRDAMHRCETVLASLPSPDTQAPAFVHRRVQGFLMCRYLFVRCDNEPAPWSSDGGRPEACFESMTVYHVLIPVCLLRMCTALLCCPGLAS